MRPKSTNIQIPILLARTLIASSLSSGLGVNGSCSDPGRGSAPLPTAQVSGAVSLAAYLSVSPPDEQVEVEVTE
jgi:hypothetical protein